MVQQSHVAVPLNFQTSELVRADQMSGPLVEWKSSEKADSLEYRRRRRGCYFSLASPYHLRRRQYRISAAKCLTHSSEKALRSDRDATTE